MIHAFVSPFGITLREGGLVDVVPVTEIAFRGREGEWFSFFLVIDSGATLSALPVSDATMLGITPQKGLPIVVSGVNGESVKGWKHTVSIRLGGEIMSLPLVLIDNDVAPRVLGREGVFKHFSIIFEEAKKRSGFLGQDTKEAGIVTTMLDKLNVGN